MMSPRFKPGDRVLVDARDQGGHVRTPRYIRGKRGVIERVCGAFGNPEELAEGKRDGAKAPLYRVRFTMADVWPSYAGPKADSIDVEIYEHWLEVERA